MSLPLVRHGWEIAFQPQLFARQYAELKAGVKRLKQEQHHRASEQHGVIHDDHARHRHDASSARHGDHGQSNACGARYCDGAD